MKITFQITAIGLLALVGCGAPPEDAESLDPAIGSASAALCQGGSCNPGSHPPPTAPGNVFLSRWCDTTAGVVFTDRSTNEMGFRMDVRDDSGGVVRSCYASAAVGTGQQRGCTVSGLQPSRSYSYTVSAYYTYTFTCACQTATGVASSAAGPYGLRTNPSGICTTSWRVGI